MQRDLRKQSKLTAGAVGVIALAASVLGAAAVSAQTGPGQSCSGDSQTPFGTQFFGLEDFGNRLLVGGVTTRVFSLAEPLPAGTYEVDAVAYDGYTNRENISPQIQEQWFAEFLGADGSVLATTGPTEDLEDLVEEDTWAGSIGSVELSVEAVSVRVQHVAPTSSSPNSVRPVCVGATLSGDDDTSTVTVDFDSDGSGTATAGVECESLRESASGNEIDIAIAEVDPDTTCEVTFSDDLDCSIAVTPADAAGDISTGQIEIITPANSTDIVVDVDCTDSDGDGGTSSTATTIAPSTTTSSTTAPTTTASTTTAPSTTAPTTTTTEVTTEVDGETLERMEAPTASIAEAQVGTPTFTG